MEYYPYIVSTLALLVSCGVALIQILNYLNSKSSHTKPIKANHSLKLISTIHEYMQGIEKIFDGGVYPEENNLFETANNQNQPDQLVWNRLPILRYIELHRGAERQLLINKMEGILLYDEETNKAIQALIDYGMMVGTKARQLAIKSDTYHGYHQHIEHRNKHGLEITKEQDERRQKNLQKMHIAEDEFHDSENHPSHSKQQEIIENIFLNLQKNFPNDPQIFKAAQEYAKSFQARYTTPSDKDLINQSVRSLEQ